MILYYVILHSLLAVTICISARTHARTHARARAHTHTYPVLLMSSLEKIMLVCVSLIRPLSSHSDISTNTIADKFNVHCLLSVHDADHMFMNEIFHANFSFNNNNNKTTTKNNKEIKTKPNQQTKSKNHMEGKCSFLRPVNHDGHIRARKEEEEEEEEDSHPPAPLTPKQQ